MDVSERPSVRRYLDGDLITIPSFIGPPQRQSLLDWALAMEPQLQLNGPGRRYRRVEHLPWIPDLHRQIRDGLQAFMGIPVNAEPEPAFGWYLSIISDGGAVHRHRDPSPPGQRHLRCNLFLQTPTEGGRPIIADQPIDIEDGMLLAFFPSERLHGSEPVGGDRLRVLCSFGYLMPDTYRLPA
jgi:hypothetical protein